jgi:hypothetical protein
VRNELERRLERIGQLVDELEAGSDPASRALAKELLHAVMEVHRSGLDRIIELTRQSGAAGEGLIERFARDRQIRTILLAHDLHPTDAVTRVRDALQAHNGAVDVLQLDHSAVRLRVNGPVSLVRTVEDSVREAAPDIESVIVERREPLVLLERRK